MISITYRNQKHNRNTIFNQLAHIFCLDYLIQFRQTQLYCWDTTVGGCFCHLFPKEQMNSLTQKSAEIMKHVYADGDCHWVSLLLLTTLYTCKSTSSSKLNLNPLYRHFENARKQLSFCQQAHTVENPDLELGRGGGFWFTCLVGFSPFYQLFFLLPKIRGDPLAPSPGSTTAEDLVSCTGRDKRLLEIHVTGYHSHS